jgi:hypothetical protein
MNKPMSKYVLLSICLIQLFLCGCGKTRDTYPIPTALHPVPPAQGDAPLNSPLEAAIDWVKLVYHKDGEEITFTVMRSSAFSVSGRTAHKNGRLPIEEFSELDRRLRVISKRDARAVNCTQVQSPPEESTIRISLATGGAVQLYSVNGNTECYRGDPTEVRDLQVYLHSLCDEYLR